MVKFIIQFLFIFILFRTNWRSKGGLIYPSNVLFGIYLVGALCGIGALYVEDYTEPFNHSYWGPMLLFDSFLLSFLMPFRLFNESKTKCIALPNIRILNFISSILIILSLFSIFYHSATVMTIFSSANLAELRNAVASGESLSPESSILNTIASVSSSFYVFVLLFYFIYSAIGGHKKRRALLLVSSLSEAIHILTFVGRDGVVFWLFMFLFYYSLFRGFLQKETKKSIKRLFVRMLLIAAIPFLAISISRFSQSEIGTNGSFISYMGQGFVNGPLLFGIDNAPLSHGASFPLYFEITGKPKPVSLGYLEIGDWKSWTFPTFVGSFYRNFGMGGLIVVCVVMGLLFFSTLGTKKVRLKFNHLILYSLYYLIFSEGIFYFREYTRGGNLFILICLFLYPLLSVLHLESDNGIELRRVE